MDHFESALIENISDPVVCGGWVADLKVGFYHAYFGFLFLTIVVGYPQLKKLVYE